MNNPLSSQDSASLPEIDVDRLLQMLRRKQETWVQWGQACQALQKAGYSPQSIFEETGFEAIQQNQIIVAAQIYANLVQLEASQAVQDYFAQRRSDILYEFRILSQNDRVKAATLAMDQQIDADEAHLIAKSIRDFSRLRQIPEGFSGQPGDAVAYDCWRLARQQADLQERSRLIGRGLRYAATSESRQLLEKLLSDFSVIKNASAPALPLYRLEQTDEMPRIVPVMGQWPLAADDLKMIPFIESEGAFQVIRYEGMAAWFAVPGWQVVVQAEDPIAFLADSAELPLEIPEPVTEVMVLLDRSQRDWSVDGYFLFSDENQLSINWFPQAPSVPLWGRIILIMRPQKVMKELETEDLWHIDE